ncbi:MFS transporter [Kitasatospora sp. NPDC049258]|uniref:MFS transporter n=1 Tax=Kitasatospora sp. NPDC049258 TaxID=3155394 RepID=UPI003440B6FB
MISSLLPAGYRSALADRRFRRLLPALALCDLGDGMSVVAVAWLAVALAPPGGGGPLVAAALVAHVLPGALGGLLLGRLLRPLAPQRLIRADALLRAVLLGCVPLAQVLGLLRPPLLVALLAGSSLLHAWGGGARYALVAGLLPSRHRLAGNALLSTSAWVSTILGPALAGLLAGPLGPAGIIGLDAVTFLALTLATGRPGSPTPPTPAPAPAGGRGGGPRDGLRVLRSRPELLALTALTWLFNLCWGPVEVALPLFVAQHSRSGAGLLGGYWAVFGLGAVAGSVAVGVLRRLPWWPVVLGIVAAHGLALLSFAATPTAVSLAGFAAAGLAYGPYSALTSHLFQERTPAAWLTTVLALRGAVLLTAAPAGSALGGVLAGPLGPRRILVAAGLAMAAVAAAAALVRALRRPGSTGRPAPAPAREPLPTIE